MRAIDPSILRTPDAPFEPGPAPMLQWVKVEDLLIDDAYQRPIRGAGRKNAEAIAAGFRWSKFAPLIVSPVAGGRYAVIDGQHRATAAALRGVEQLPAQVVIADQAEQAAAFKAVNGQTTRIHALELHRAAVAASDPDALAINAACALADVVICARPRDAGRIKAGETLAINTIRTHLRRSETVLVTALECISRTKNNVPGALSATIIDAICAVLTDNPGLQEDKAALFAAFDGVVVQREEDKAKFTLREKGIALWEVLRDRLSARLQEQMSRLGQRSAA